MRTRIGLPPVSRLGLPATIPISVDRSLGLPEKRATSCVEILRDANRICESVTSGIPWEIVLSARKGVGPWTISTFRIMVLRDPDVLPLGDVGLNRAVSRLYGPEADLALLAENWRPFRSVACWHLWRTLGNEQLG